MYGTASMIKTMPITHMKYARSNFMKDPLSRT
jgi:hypothetical protein